MSTSLLCEPPFTGITPSGLDGLFEPKQLDEFFLAQSKIEASAFVV